MTHDPLFQLIPLVDEHIAQVDVRHLGIIQITGLDDIELALQLVGQVGHRIGQRKLGVLVLHVRAQTQGRRLGGGQQSAQPGRVELLYAVNGHGQDQQLAAVIHSRFQGSLPADGHQVNGVGIDLFIDIDSVGNQRQVHRQLRVQAR